MPSIVWELFGTCLKNCFSPCRCLISEAIISKSSTTDLTKYEEKNNDGYTIKNIPLTPIPIAETLLCVILAASEDFLKTFSLNFSVAQL